MTEFPAVYPEREPEHIDNSRSHAEWRGCRVHFDTDTPDDTGTWEITWTDDKHYSHDLPQALVELLVEKHYDEILTKIFEDMRP